MFSFKVAVLASRNADDSVTQMEGPTFHRFRGTFSFAQVVGAIAEMLPRTKAERVVTLEYTDEDGDVVRISSELEWRECLRLQAAAAAPTPATSVVIRLTARWGDKLRKPAAEAPRRAGAVDNVAPQAAAAAAAAPSSDVPASVDTVAAVAAVAEPTRDSSSLTSVAAAAAAADADFESLSDDFFAADRCSEDYQRWVRREQDELSDDEFVAQRASRDDEWGFDREQQYMNKVVNVPTMTPAVALLAPATEAPALPAAPVAPAPTEPAVVRPWNNANQNARVLHGIFPSTPLKTIKAMLRKRRNNLNEVADLLAAGSTTA